jgi:protein TonB
MREAARWFGSFALVMGAHAAAVFLWLGWAEAVEPYSPPPAAVMIELAPLPAAPEAMPNEAPPGPDLSEVVPEPEPPPPVDLKPPPVAEVVLPEPEPPPPVDLKPPPPKVVEKKPTPPKPTQPKVSAPQAAPQQAAVAAAPMQGAAPEPPSASLPTWKGLLLRHLERHKRYPNDAQRRRHEGTPYVHFVMSRDGRVLSARIERPSGTASLDQEGLELLQRAQPLPPLPSDQPGETITLVVPIQFFLRR